MCGIGDANADHAHITMLLVRISSGLLTTGVFLHLNRFSLKRAEYSTCARDKKKYTVEPLLIDTPQANTFLGSQLFFN